MNIESATNDLEALKDLMKKKKKLLAKIRRYSKAQAKARVEKKKINSELRRIRGVPLPFEGLTPIEAKELAAANIDSVNPSDLYPKDLEKEFDKIHKPGSMDNKYKTINLGRIPERPISSGRTYDNAIEPAGQGALEMDADETVGDSGADHQDLDHEEVEVVDLSDQ